MSFIKCYGCHKIFIDQHDLSFICNCINEGFVKYRGICQECVTKEVFIPRNHSLSKVVSSKFCSIQDLMPPKNIKYEPNF